jgi:hypothetical protein
VNADHKVCVQRSQTEVSDLFTDDGSDNVVNGLNDDPLNLIEADFVAPAIIELRRSRRGVVRHGGGFF